MTLIITLKITMTRTTTRTILKSRTPSKFKLKKLSVSVARVKPTVSSAVGQNAVGRNADDVPDSNPAGNGTESRFFVFKGKRKAKSDGINDDGQENGKENEDLPLATKRLKTVTPTKKRGKIEWTKDETFFVWKGVQVYGEGNWGRILDAYQNKFHASRTNISIKDRWRTMVKNGIDKQLSREQREKAKK